jgi:hypothetical protein
MGRPAKDRVTVSFYLDREIAEELRSVKNKSDFMNDLLWKVIDRIGLFGTEDLENAIKELTKKKMAHIWKEASEELEREMRKGSG